MGAGGRRVATARGSLTDPGSARCRWAMDPPRSARRQPTASSTCRRGGPIDRCRKWRLSPGGLGSAWKHSRRRTSSLRNSRQSESRQRRDRCSHCSRVTRRSGSPLRHPWQVQSREHRAGHDPGGRSDRFGHGDRLSAPWHAVRLPERLPAGRGRRAARRLRGDGAVVPGKWGFCGHRAALGCRDTIARKILARVSTGPSTEAREAVNRSRQAKPSAERGPHSIPDHRTRHTSHTSSTATRICKLTRLSPAGG